MRRGLPLLLLGAGCGLLPRAAAPAPPSPPAASPSADVELRRPLPADAPCSRGFLPDERHYALDLAAPAGTPVLASAAGVVVRASPHRDYGLTVVVEHAAATYTLYAHLSSLAVSAGDPVAAGATLGAVGDTGNARGAHLHFEVLRAGAPLPLRGEGALGIPGAAYRVDPAAVVQGVAAGCGDPRTSARAPDRH